MPEAEFWQRRDILPIRAHRIGGYSYHPMSKHDVESEGENPRDHVHERHHFLKHAHRDWRVWTAVVVMLAMIFVYVFTVDLSLRPAKTAAQPTPAANAP